MAMSEEQWKDLKFKIQIGVFLAIVGAAIFAIGPGLVKFADHAKKHRTEPWAPKWLYNVGRLYEMTGRQDKAKAIYEDFYLIYSGDESKVDFSQVRAEMPKVRNKNEEDPNDRWYVPWVAARYTPETRPAWVGGEGAAAHPLLAMVMYRMLKMYEEDRNYMEVRYLYRAVLYTNLGAGTEGYQRMDESKKRDIVRSF